VSRKIDRIPSFRRDDGQALVEYGLIITLVALICVAALTTIGTIVQGWLNQITGAL
jgi:Flp pilus assembly pilin Flp